MSSKTVLVTGASGFLGYAVLPQLVPHYRVVGTYYRQYPTDRPQVQWERINLMQVSEIGAMVRQIQPDAILHLAALSNTTFCEANPGMSHHINVYATIALAETAAQQGIPLLFASTDLVFNGNAAPYEEDDLTHPLSQYGQQKQVVEELLLTDFDRTLVGRLPLLFGKAPSYGQNFFVNSIAALKNDESIHAFVDEYRSMVSTTVAATWWALALKYALDTSIPWTKKERLLHFSSTEGLSRYAFMLAVAQQLGVNPELVAKGKQSDAPNAHTRPADVRLNNGLARKLFNYEPPALADQLRVVFD